jgi:glutathione peroxidase
MAVAALLTGVAMDTSIAGEPPRRSVLDFTMKTIDGADLPLSEYKGKVLLLVNVASKCGHTPQYKDLQALYEKYQESGLVVLGFPANNFGSQEPGTDKEIKAFCSTAYNVSFPMFSKISVKGNDQHPLYAFITGDAKVGGDVKWNFQKYLVDRSGRLIAKFASAEKPLSTDVIEAVEAALKEKQ